MAIGALAAAVHGVVRASLDADALISIGSEQAERELLRALEEMGLSVEHRAPDQEDPVRGILVIKDRWKNRVDLLLGIKGLDSSAYQRVIKVAIAGAELKVVGLEDFVAMKVFAGGAQDLADVRAALAVSGNEIDSKLALALADGYGPETRKVLEELLTESGWPV